MTERADFVVKFGSNAADWAKGLETQLKPAHDAVDALNSKLGALEARAGRVRLPEGGGTPAPAPRTPPPPAGQRPPTQPQPVRQQPVTVAPIKVDTSGLDDAIGEFGTALNKITRDLALAAGTIKNTAEVVQEAADKAADEALRGVRSTNAQQQGNAPGTGRFQTVPDEVKVARADEKKKGKKQQQAAREESRAADASMEAARVTEDVADRTMRVAAAEFDALDAREVAAQVEENVAQARARTAQSQLLAARAENEAAILAAQTAELQKQQARRGRSRVGSAPTGATLPAGGGTILASLSDSSVSRMVDAVQKNVTATQGVGKSVDKGFAALGKSVDKLRDALKPATASSSQAAPLTPEQQALKTSASQIEYRIKEAQRAQALAQVAQQLGPRENVSAEDRAYERSAQLRAQIKQAQRRDRLQDAMGRVDSGQSVSRSLAEEIFTKQSDRDIAVHGNTAQIKRMIESALRNPSMQGLSPVSILEAELATVARQTPTGDGRRPRGWQRPPGQRVTLDPALVAAAVGATSGRAYQKLLAGDDTSRVYVENALPYATANAGGKSVAELQAELTALGPIPQKPKRQPRTSGKKATSGPNVAARSAATNAQALDDIDHLTQQIEQAEAKMVTANEQERKVLLQQQSANRELLAALDGSAQAGPNALTPEAAQAKAITQTVRHLAAVLKTDEGIPLGNYSSAAQAGLQRSITTQQAAVADLEAKVAASKGKSGVVGMRAELAVARGKLGDYRDAADALKPKDAAGKYRQLLADLAMVDQELTNILPTARSTPESSARFDQLTSVANSTIESLQALKAANPELGGGKNRTLPDNMNPILDQAYSHLEGLKSQRGTLRRLKALMKMRDAMQAGRDLDAETVQTATAGSPNAHFRSLGHRDLDGVDRRRGVDYINTLIPKITLALADNGKLPDDDGLAGEIAEAEQTLAALGGNVKGRPENHKPLEQVRVDGKTRAQRLKKQAEVEDKEQSKNLTKEERLARERQKTAELYERRQQMANSYQVAIGKLMEAEASATGPEKVELGASIEFWEKRLARVQRQLNKMSRGTAPAAQSQARLTKQVRVDRITNLMIAGSEDFATRALGLEGTSGAEDTYTQFLGRTATGGDSETVREGDDDEFRVDEETLRRVDRAKRQGNLNAGRIGGERQEGFIDKAQLLEIAASYDAEGYATGVRSKDTKAAIVAKIQAANQKFVASGMVTKNDLSVTGAVPTNTVIPQSVRRVLNSRALVGLRQALQMTPEDRGARMLIRGDLDSGGRGRASLTSNPELITGAAFAVGSSGSARITGLPRGFSQQFGSVANSPQMEEILRMAYEHESVRGSQKRSLAIGAAQSFLSQNPSFDPWGAEGQGLLASIQGSGPDARDSRDALRRLYGGIGSVDKVGLPMADEHLARIGEAQLQRNILEERLLALKDRGQNLDSNGNPTKEYADHYKALQALDARLAELRGPKGQTEAFSRGIVARSASFKDFQLAQESRVREESGGRAFRDSWQTAMFGRMTAIGDNKSSSSLLPGVRMTKNGAFPVDDFVPLQLDDRISFEKRFARLRSAIAGAGEAMADQGKYAQQLQRLKREAAKAGLSPEHKAQLDEEIAATEAELGEKAALAAARSSRVLDSYEDTFQTKLNTSDTVREDGVTVREYTRAMQNQAVERDRGQARRNAQSHAKNLKDRSKLGLNLTDPQAMFAELGRRQAADAALTRVRKGESGQELQTLVAAAGVEGVDYEALEASQRRTSLVNRLQSLMAGRGRRTDRRVGNRRFAKLEGDDLRQFNLTYRELFDQAPDGDLLSGKYLAELERRLARLPDADGAKGRGALENRLKEVARGGMYNVAATDAEGLTAADRLKISQASAGLKQIPQATGTATDLEAIRARYNIPQEQLAQRVQGFRRGSLTLEEFRHGAGTPQALAARQASEAIALAASRATADPAAVQKIHTEAAKQIAKVEARQAKAMKVIEDYQSTIGTEHDAAKDMFHAGYQRLKTLMGDLGETVEPGGSLRIYDGAQSGKLAGAEQRLAAARTKYAAAQDAKARAAARKEVVAASSSRDQLGFSDRNIDEMRAWRDEIARRREAIGYSLRNVGEGSREYAKGEFAPRAARLTAARGELAALPLHQQPDGSMAVAKRNRPTQRKLEQEIQRLETETAYFRENQANFVRGDDGEFRLDTRVAAMRKKLASLTQQQTDVSAQITARRTKRENLLRQLIEMAQMVNSIPTLRESLGENGFRALVSATAGEQSAAQIQKQAKVDEARLHAQAKEAARQPLVEDLREAQTLRQGSLSTVPKSVANSPTWHALQSLAARAGKAPHEMTAADIAKAPALLGADGVERARLPLAQHGIQWNAQVNPTLNAAKNVKQLLDEVARLLKSGTLQIVEWTGSLPQELAAASKVQTVALAPDGTFGREGDRPANAGWDVVAEQISRARKAVDTGGAGLSAAQIGDINTGLASALGLKAPEGSGLLPIEKTSQLLARAGQLVTKVVDAETAARPAKPLNVLGTYGQVSLMSGGFKGTGAGIDPKVARALSLVTAMSPPRIAEQGGDFTAREFGAFTASVAKKLGQDYQGVKGEGYEGVALLKEILARGGLMEGAHEVKAVEDAKPFTVEGGVDKLLSALNGIHATVKELLAAAGGGGKKPPKTPATAGMAEEPEESGLIVPGTVGRRVKSKLMSDPAAAEGAAYQEKAVRDEKAVRAAEVAAYRENTARENTARLNAKKLSDAETQAYRENAARERARTQPVKVAEGEAYREKALRENSARTLAKQVKDAESEAYREKASRDGAARTSGREAERARVDAERRAEAARIAAQQRAAFDTRVSEERGRLTPGTQGQLDALGGMVGTEGRESAAVAEQQAKVYRLMATELGQAGVKAGAFRTAIKVLFQSVGAASDSTTLGHMAGGFTTGQRTREQQIQAQLASMQGASTAGIRSWARDEGMQVANSGRLSTPVLAAHRQAIQSLEVELRQLQHVRQGDQSISEGVAASIPATVRAQFDTAVSPEDAVQALLRAGVARRDAEDATADKFLLNPQEAAGLRRAVSGQQSGARAQTAVQEKTTQDAAKARGVLHTFSQLEQGTVNQVAAFANLLRVEKDGTKIASEQAAVFRVLMTDLARTTSGAKALRTAIQDLFESMGASHSLETMRRLEREVVATGGPSVADTLGASRRGIWKTDDAFNAFEASMPAELSAVMGMLKGGGGAGASDIYDLMRASNYQHGLSREYAVRATGLDPNGPEATALDQRALHTKAMDAQGAASARAATAARQAAAEQDRLATAEKRATAAATVQARAFDALSQQGQNLARSHFENRDSMSEGTRIASLAETMMRLQADPGYAGMTPQIARVSTQHVARLIDPEMAGDPGVMSQLTSAMGMAQARKSGLTIGQEQARATMDGFSRVFGGGGGFWARMMHTTGTFIVRNFSAGLVFGITNVLQDAIMQGIETESTFVRVSDALEQTGRDSGGLRSELSKMSSDYGVALRDVYTTAAGLTGLFDKTDVGNEKLLGLTEVAVQLQLISGGALNATEAMKALSSVTSAYSGMAPEHIADVLTTIQNRLSVNIEESIEGVARLSGQAVELGLDFEHAAVYVSAIAKFTNQTGASAGEQFSRMLGQLQTGRTQNVVIKALKSVGVDASENFQKRQYQEIIDQLMLNYQGMTPEMQSQVAVAVGGLRQAASTAGLLLKGPQALDTVTAAMYSQGAAAARAEKMSEQLHSTLKRLREGFVAFAASIVEFGALSAIEVTVKGAVTALKAMTDVLGQLNELVSNTPLLGKLNTIMLTLLGFAAGGKIAGMAFKGMRGSLQAQARIADDLMGAPFQRANAVPGPVGRHAAPGTVPVGPTYTRPTMSPSVMAIPFRPTTGMLTGAANTLEAASQALAARAAAQIPLVQGATPGDVGAAATASQRQRLAAAGQSAASGLAGAAGRGLDKTSGALGALANSGIAMNVAFMGIIATVGLVAEGFQRLKAAQKDYEAFFKDTYVDKKGDPTDLAGAGETSDRFKEFADGLREETSNSRGVTFANVFKALLDAPGSGKTFAGYYSMLEDKATGNVPLDKANDQSEFIRAAIRSIADIGQDKAPTALPGAYQAPAAPPKITPQTLGLGVLPDLPGPMNMVIPKPAKPAATATPAPGAPSVPSVADDLPPKGIRRPVSKIGQLDQKMAEINKEIDARIEAINSDKDLGPISQATMIAELERARASAANATIRAKLVAKGFNEVDTLTSDQMDALISISRTVLSIGNKAAAATSSITEAAAKANGLDGDSIFADAIKDLQGGTLGNKRKRYASALRAAIKVNAAALAAAPEGGEEHEKLIAAGKGLQQEYASVTGDTTNEKTALAQAKLEEARRLGDFVEANKQAAVILAEAEKKYNNGLLEESGLIAARRAYADTLSQTSATQLQLIQAQQALDLARMLPGDAVGRANLSVAQARANEAAAKKRFKANPTTDNEISYTQAQATTATAVYGAQSAEAAYLDAKAGRAVALAQAGGNSVRIATASLNAARIRLRAALKNGDVHSAEYQNAKNAVIAGEAAERDALFALADAKSNLASVIKGGRGDTVGVAAEALKTARRKLQEIVSKGGGTKDNPEFVNAQAAEEQAKAGLRDAKFQDELDSIDFNQQMGTITGTEAIRALQEMLKATDLTKQQRRQLMLKIKGLQDDIRNTLTGSGLNIPTEIKLPTAYEVRRSLAVDKAQGAILQSVTDVRRMAADTVGSPVGQMSAMGITGGDSSTLLVSAMSEVRDAVLAKGAQNVYQDVDINASVPSAAMVKQIVQAVVEQLGQMSRTAQRSNTSTPRTVRN